MIGRCVRACLVLGGMCGAKRLEVVVVSSHNWTPNRTPQALFPNIVLHSGAFWRIWYIDALPFYFILWDFPLHFPVVRPTGALPIRPRRLGVHFEQRHTQRRNVGVFLTLAGSSDRIFPMPLRFFCFFTVLFCCCFFGARVCHAERRLQPDDMPDSSGPTYPPPRCSSSAATPSRPTASTRARQLRHHFAHFGPFLARFAAPWHLLYQVSMLIGADPCLQSDVGTNSTSI